MRFLNFSLIIASLLKLTNTSAQWRLTSPFEGALVKSVVIENSLIAGTGTKGVFISNDNGITWTASNTGLTNSNISSFATVGDSLFAGTMGNGVFVSTDHGLSWAALSNTGLTNPFVESLLNVGDSLFASTKSCFGCNGGGVFMSTDKGASWTPMNNGITNSSAKSLASIGDYLFTVSPGVGIFRSNDGGTSWNAVNSGYDNRVISLVTNGTNLYAATQQGVYLSTDYGDTWKGINKGLENVSSYLPNPVYSLAISGKYLFAGSANNLYMSTNNGATWGSVNSGVLYVQSVFISKDTVFASSANGFYSRPILDLATITTITPIAATIGSSITIKGTGFSSTPSENMIRIKGTNAFASTSTKDSITFIVPNEAQTGGTISVVVGDEVATFSEQFGVIPNITYFSPSSGPPRTAVTILGTGFTASPDDIAVKVNGRPAFLYPNSSTSLGLIVPDSVTSGPISITINGQTGTSTNSFVVTEPPPLPDPGGYGNMTWTQPIRSGFRCSSMATDNNHSLFFTGELANYSGHQRNYFNYTLFPGYSFDSYLIKSDTSYNIKWRKIIKSSPAGVIHPAKVQTDVDGNVILTGWFAQSIAIDSLTFNLPGDQSHPLYGLFLSKFNSQGKLLWFNFIAANTSASVNDLKIDSSGNIYLAGSGSGLWNFYNNGSIANSIVADINGQFGYVAQYDRDGVFKWVKSFTHGYDVRIKALEIDKNKNIYLTGSWYGMGTFESAPKASPSEDIIIAKLDSARNLVWLKQIGAYYNDVSESGNDIALDEKLNCFYVTGSFLKGDFGSGTINSDDANIFLARYSLNGNLIWVKKMGTWSGAASFTEAGTNVIIDRDSFVYLGGVIGTCLSSSTCPGFDGIPLSAYQDPNISNIYNDGFIGKYSPSGKMIWVQHFGDPDIDDYITDFRKDDRDNLYFSGVAGRQSIFGTYQLPWDYSSDVGFASKIKDGQEIYLELSDYNVEIAADSNLTRSFQIVTNQGWSISSNVSWLSLSLPEGKGSSEIVLTAQMNFSNERYGFIKATSDGGATKQLNVRQLKKSTTVTVTDISSGKDQSLVIYPNPARDVIHFSAELNFEEAQVLITDITGKDVINSKVVGNEIDVRSLSPGLYFIKIFVSGDPVIRRFVKI